MKLKKSSKTNASLKLKITHAAEEKPNKKKRNTEGKNTADEKKKVKKNKKKEEESSKQQQKKKNGKDFFSKKKAKGESGGGGKAFANAKKGGRKVEENFIKSKRRKAAIIDDERQPVKRKTKKNKVPQKKLEVGKNKVPNEEDGKATTTKMQKMKKKKVEETKKKAEELMEEETLMKKSTTKRKRPWRQAVRHKAKRQRMAEAMENDAEEKAVEEKAEEKAEEEVPKGRINKDGLVLIPVPNRYSAHIPADFAVKQITPHDNDYETETDEEDAKVIYYSAEKGKRFVDSITSQLDHAKSIVVNNTKSPKTGTGNIDTTTAAIAAADENQPAEVKKEEKKKKSKKSRRKRLRNKQRVLANNEQLGDGNRGDAEDEEQNGGTLQQQNPRARLEAARFRFLNEKLYTQPSTSAAQLFEEDPSAFAVYHRGYKQQLNKWPVNPLLTIALDLSTLAPGSVVADCGCGEAELAKRLEGTKLTVHSFDLVALNARVVASDMAQLPLEKASVDVCVYCLSLMGTNLAQFFREAHRVLKKGGKLKIAEVTSRFQNVKAFVTALAKMGFQLKRKKEIGNGFFTLLSLQKVGKVENKRPLGLHLQPCLYKKR